MVLRSGQIDLQAAASAYTDVVGVLEGPGEFRVGFVEFLHGDAAEGQPVQCGTIQAAVEQDGPDVLQLLFRGQQDLVSRIAGQPVDDQRQSAVDVFDGCSRSLPGKQTEGAFLVGEQLLRAAFGGI